MPTAAQCQARGACELENKDPISFRKRKATRKGSPFLFSFQNGSNPSGADERHIGTVNANAVALATIEGLNKKLSEKEREIDKLRHENQELAEQLRRVEEVLKAR